MAQDARGVILNILGEAVRPPHVRVPQGIQSLPDYERQAQHHVEARVWAHIQGGADQHLSLRHNRLAFDAWQLVPSPVVDLSHAHTRVTLFDEEFDSPILLAPVAYQKLVHPDGELATIQAATAMRVAMVVSTLASCTLEDIASVAEATARELGQGAPRWFQLYLQPERAHTLELVRRAEAAGYTALVWTIDASIKRSAIELPPGVRAANLRHLPEAPPRPGIVGPIIFGTPLVHQVPDWDDLAWLRSHTRLPLVVKGVLSPTLARRLVAAGADGIIVSNHGGRVLDGAVPPLDMVSEIIDAVGTSVPVLLDGGIRWGTDIVKALALGARAVLVGRPQLHALAVAGMPGVAHLLYLLKAELELAMAQLGCASIAELGPHVLRRCRAQPAAFSGA
mgnify:CR=1 FL=1